MIEMKPCAHCGSDNILAMGPPEPVYCRMCHVRAPDHATWNTRHDISDVLIEALITKALCQSGKFETGQGTCAAICMEVLGSARSGPHGCPNAARVHGKLASSIADALRQAKGGEG